MPHVDTINQTGGAVASGSSLRPRVLLWRSAELVRWVSLPIVVAVLGGCGPTLRRFDNAPPLWVDPDQAALAKTPSKYYSGIRGDAVDKLVLRPLAQLFAVPDPGEATNVNSIDEVPNSSWFQNRIGWFDLSPEEVARGECGDIPTLSQQAGPWTVVGAKPDGANPGFVISAPDGYRYLLKVDGYSQPLRATTADVVGSRLYWAIGYHSVCNEVVYFHESNLRLDPKATTDTKTGGERPLEVRDVNAVLAKAFRLKDGQIRASVSRFVPGKPVGPFKYEGRRRDDPNDAVPHEDRRELRAAHLPAAWLNHIDAREQNTLDVLVEQDGKSALRHYKLDWGDALGLGWEPDRLGRRFGYSYAVDVRQMTEDFLTLGLLDRPWNHLQRTKVQIFGYYNAEDFVPSKWKGVYPIPAFDRRTPRDILWMVRILSRITDEHIRAIVREAKLPDRRQADYLTAALIGRRDKFFFEYLSRYVPLARFHVVRRDAGKLTQSVCFEDLAIKHGVAQGDETYYQLRFYGGAKADQQLGWAQFNPDESHPEWSCIQLPLGGRRPADLAGASAGASDPRRYGILRIWVHETPTIQPLGEVRLHFYDLGETEGFRLVGIERPEKFVLPDDYH